MAYKVNKVSFLSEGQVEGRSMEFGKEKLIAFLKENVALYPPTYPTSS